MTKKLTPQPAVASALSEMADVMADTTRKAAYVQAQAAYTMALDTLEAPTIAIFANLQAVMGGWFSEQQGFDRVDFPMDIALMHSELSEALEAHRTGEPDDKVPELDARAVELADVLTRLLHAADKYQLPLAEAFFTKMKANLQRPFKHGKEY